MKRKYVVSYFLFLSIFFSFSTSLIAQTRDKINGRDIHVQNAVSGDSNDREVWKRTDYNRVVQVGQKTIPDISRMSVAKSSDYRGTATYETILQGSVIYSDAWTFLTAKPGIYTFPATFNTALALKKEDNRLASFTGVYKDGKYYSISLLETSSGYYDNYYRTFDATTWSQLSVILEPMTTENIPVDMSYDPVTGNVYALTKNLLTGDYSTLSIFNLEDASHSPIGNLPESFNAIAVSNIGILYGISNEGNLYTINKTTAAATLIGSSGIKADIKKTGSAAFDNAIGKLFWSVIETDTSSSLYEISISDGGAILISVFPNKEQVTALHVLDPIAPLAAPDAVSELAVNFISPGSLTGKVKFKLPSITYGGQTLTGNLDVKIQVDQNTPINASNLTPGTNYESSDITFQGGMQTITVSVSNAVGEGPKASISLWTGQDVPKAVTNLFIGKSAEGYPLLKWTASTESLHGGYLDVSAIYYKIVRNPDGVTVANNVTGSMYKDTSIPENIATYSYTVIACSDAGEGEPATSDEETFNEVYTIPYTEKFEDVSSFNLWTVHNLNGGETWVYSSNNKAAQYERDTDRAGDDWLISPPIVLEAGTTYQFSYSEKTGSTSFSPENFKVTLGTNTDPDTHTRVLATHEKLKHTNWIEHTVTFTVSSTGKYYLGFYAYSEKINYHLYVSNLNIEILYNAGTPGAVTEWDVVPGEQGAPSAKISFTTPSVSSSGEILNNITSVNIYRGDSDEPVKSFPNPALGIPLEWTDMAPDNGLNTYAIVPSNDYGKGVIVSKTVFVGEDAPAMVSDLSVTNAGANAIVSWVAPSVGKDSGYINAADLKYTVTRNPGGVVAENIVETTFTDSSIETALAKYSYTVVPSTTKGEGDANTSEVVIIGEGYSMPYSETFETAASLDLWRIIDVNGDNKKWAWSYSKYVQYAWNTTQSADDWLISPPLRLYEGYTYEIKYKAWSSSATNKESLKVTLGLSQNPDDHTIILEDYPELTNNQEPRANIFVAPSDGKYHLGFYAYSQKNKVYLRVDNIEVTVLSAAGVPGPVSDLNVLPDAQGELLATISFKTPSTTFNGTSLAGLTYVKIYRGEEETPVHTIDNPAMGVVLSWVDENPVYGMNTYRVVAINEAGKGNESVASAFIGTDVPTAVTNLLLAEINKKAVISWTAPTKGKNGGYIDVSTLKYKIERKTVGSTDVIVLAEDFTGTTYTDDILDLQQKVYSYTVTPVTSSGTGEPAVSNGLVLGSPYPAPFHESFANLTEQNMPWVTEVIDESKATWILSATGKTPTAEPQDKDGGLVTFNSYSTIPGSTARFISPAIDISKMINPRLTFYMWHIDIPGQSKNDRMQLEISVDGEEFKEFHNVIMLSENNNGWTLHEVSLLDYIESDKINISFKGISSQGFNIHIDNISIVDGYGLDLEAASLVAPSEIQVGSIGTFSVQVRNNGASAVGTLDYKVNLYRDEELFMTKDGVNIPALKFDYVDFDISAELYEAGNTYEFYATIEYSADEFMDNNRSETKSMTVAIPVYPGVTSLEGSADNFDVTLKWVAPNKDILFEEVTESFESYVPFIIDNIGDWKVVDMDGSRTISTSGLPEFPNVFVEKAFQVFNPTALNITHPSWYPYTGEQMLVCFANNSEGGANNDWLISPELSEKAQEVSFQVKSTHSESLERIVFHYSTTGNNTYDFVKLSEGDYIEVPTQWTEFTFQLPEGAKYFAIQCVSDHAFILFLDDITFTKGDKNIKNLELEGYNIYRDGVKITDTPSDKSKESYIDKVLEKGTYKYKVTAVYNNGESYYSDEIPVQVSGEGIEDIQYGYKIYASSGSIIVEGAIGNKVSIVTADGKIIHTVMASDYENIPVANGIYLVKIDNQVTKVVVQ